MALLWRYLEGATGHDAGFEVPTFNDSAWATGYGAFARNDLGGYEVFRTPWVGANNEITMRAHLSVPAFATSVTLHFWIDFSGSVWVNGALVATVTAPNTTPLPPAGGLSIPLGSWLVGDNVIAVRAFADAPGHNYVNLTAAISPFGYDVNEIVAPGTTVNFIGTLDDAYDRSIRPVRNEPGSGQFTINRSSPNATAAILKPGNLVKVRYPEIDPGYIFAFFMEQGDFTLVSADEQGGEEIRIGGRGALSYWDRAVWLSSKFTIPWWPATMATPPAGTKGAVQVVAGTYRRYTIAAGVITGFVNFTTAAGFSAYFDSRVTYLWPSANSKRFLVHLTTTEDPASPDYTGYYFHPHQNGVTEILPSYATGVTTSVLLSDISPDTPGAILYRLFQEATNAARPVQPIPLMTIDFTATTDSTGAAWSTTAALAGMTAELGETYLDTIMKLVSTGVIDVEMGPNLDMHAYNSRGRTLTSTAFGGGPSATLALSAAADDIIDTAAAHVFVAGQRVRFTSLTGGAGLVTGTDYYVIAANLAATTLQISLTSGGAAINFTTDITAGVLAPGPVVRFVKGANIADKLARERDDNPVATFIEVVGLDGVTAQTSLPDAATRVAREAATTGDSNGAAALSAIGLATLNSRLVHSDAVGFRLATGNADATGRYLPGPRGTANGDFWTSDLVTLHTGTAEQDFNNAALPVYAITIAEDEGGNLDVTPEVGSVLGEAERRLYAPSSSPASLGTRSQYSETAVAETSADVDVHIADTIDAHDASAVSFVPAAGIAATDVQAAIVEDAGDLVTHAAAADPHAVYQRESEKGVASGYASLGADTLVPQEQLGTGAQDGTKFLRDDGTWQAAGSSSLTVKDEGAALATAASSIDFVGAGVTASGTGADKTVTIPGVTALSSRADATANITTTATAADATGATLSLAAGTYIVVGNFDVTRQGATNDRVFEGILDVAGVDEADLAVWSMPVATAGLRDIVSQVWRITLAATTTVKLQARHSGGTAGDFLVTATNSAIVATQAGAGGTYTVLSDTFNRADGAVGNADGGSLQRWFVHTGTWAIATNRLNETTVTTERFIIAYAGWQRGKRTFVWTMNTKPATGDGGLFFRANSATAISGLLLNVEATYKLYTRPAGAAYTAVTVVSGTPATPADGDAITVVDDGFRITVTVNGGAAVVYDTELWLGPWVGFRDSGGNGMTHDSIVVTDT